MFARTHFQIYSTPFFVLLCESPPPASPQMRQLIVRETTRERQHQSAAVDARSRSRRRRRGAREPASYSNRYAPAPAALQMHSASDHSDQTMATKVRLSRLIRPAAALLRACCTSFNDANVSRTLRSRRCDNEPVFTGVSKQALVNPRFPFAFVL
jgi:hypothetical protein